MDPTMNLRVGARSPVPHPATAPAPQRPTAPPASLHLSSQPVADSYSDARSTTLLAGAKAAAEPAPPTARPKDKKGFWDVMGTTGKAFVSVVKDPLSAVFRDQANDGKVMDLRTGAAHDFSVTNLERLTYRPVDGGGRATLVFVPGANQVASVAVARAKDHADNLGTPLALIHNGSYLAQGLSEGHPVDQVLRKVEEVENLSLITRVAVPKSMRHVQATVMDALTHQKPLYISAESQGTMVLGGGLRRAEGQFIKERSRALRDNGLSSAEAKVQAREDWTVAAGRYLHVTTFSNAVSDLPEGPNYLHVMMRGDGVAEKFGSTPDKPHPGRTHFLRFDNIFPPGSYEPHNMMFTMELFKETCRRNDIPVGDFRALFRALGTGRALRVATPAQVPWPADMKDCLWDKSLDLDALLEAYRHTH
jgi:hypothetical protein